MFQYLENAKHCFGPLSLIPPWLYPLPFQLLGLAIKCGDGRACIFESGIELGHLAYADNPQMAALDFLPGLLCNLNNPNILDAVFTNSNQPLAIFTVSMK
jgi:hypothetical protein